MAALSSKCAMAGTSVTRMMPFTPARPTFAPRQIVVQAQHGLSHTFKRTAGALAAAQLALCPLSGAAIADTLPLNSFSNQQLQKNVLFGFGEKVEEAKKAVKEASQTKDDPAERVTPEGAATTSEAQQTNAENVRREAENASPPGGDARSPTGPQSAVGNFSFDTAGLQKNVLFGFGEKTATKTGEDPAEKVVPEGRATTNEAQQTNAESVRRQAENAGAGGNQSGAAGDARAPTGPQKAL